MPSGSFGIGTEILRIELSRPPGRPLLDTRCTLIWVPLTLVIRQVAEPLVTSRLMDAFTLWLPTGFRVRPAAPTSEPSCPPASDPIAFDRLPKAITPAPDRWPTVPPLKPEFRWTLLSSALMFWISTGPALTLRELIWMSWKWRPITWVRNGKPLMDTSGLLEKPSSWIWEAILPCT